MNIRLKRFNTGLALLLIGLSIYIIALPLAPALTWWIKHSAPIVSKSVPRSVMVDKIKIPTTNSLAIPSMDLLEPIYDGESIYTVNKGIWRRPNSSTPDKGGNTVLVGHRFTYAGSAVFYNLDKVKKDDQMVVYWQGKAYEYKVTDVVIVSPNEVSVEAPTNESVLTVYTCTPLVTAKNRLVIRARLVNTI